MKPATFGGSMKNVNAAAITEARNVSWVELGSMLEIGSSYE